MELPGLREGVTLAGLTTYRIGGPAKFYLEARDESALADALAWAARTGTKTLTLGGGSNVLVDDEGFPGLVLRLTGSFRRIEHPRAGEPVLAGGGAPLSGLSLAMVREGYGDFLFLTGIPGTVGGALVMNAGTGLGEFANLLEWAQLITPGGEKVTLARDELALGYRTSRLKTEGGWTVLRVGLKPGSKSDVAELLEKRGLLLAARRAKEPKNKNNCGSVFRNPPGDISAGALIEEAGLKGVALGGARVAPEHANWIINEGGARAADVRELCALITRRVKERFGVELTRELIFIPQDLS